jgi:hypothetical protein
LDNFNRVTWKMYTAKYNCRAVLIIVRIIPLARIHAKTIETLLRKTSSACQTQTLAR